MNLLHEFWNQHSDACPLEASEQEAQEKAFEEWMKKLPFDKAVRPLIQRMNEPDYHPHMKIIVESTGAELVEGVSSTGLVAKYIKD